MLYAGGILHLLESRLRYGTGAGRRGQRGADDDVQSWKEHGVDAEMLGSWKRKGNRPSRQQKDLDEFHQTVMEVCSMDKFIYSYPTKVYFGEGSAKETLPAELGKVGLRRRLHQGKRYL